MNEIVIKLDRLYDLNISQYCFLIFLSLDKREYAYGITGITQENVDQLVEKKYLSESYELLDKGKRVAQNSNIQQLFMPTPPIDDFVEKYRALFPQGNNQSGYPFKGDKQGCIKKMRRFMKIYPKFTEEIILEATRAYIHSHFMKSYQYMQTAAYLIEKDGVSNLAGLCESHLIRQAPSRPRGGGFEIDLD